MQILITGGNGQLGTSLRKVTANDPDNSYFFTDIDELDICDLHATEQFFTENKIELCINCAGYTAVDKAESDAEKAFLINHTAVKNLSDSAAKTGAYLIHISTDYVFDGKNHLPYQETDPVQPTSVYGKSKAEGEIPVLNYEKGLVIRTAWLYSEFGNNFFKSMIKLTRERESLGVVFDQIGTPTYAPDLAKAIFHIAGMIKNEGFHPGVFHFSNEGVASWYDFAFEIGKLNQSNCCISPIESYEYPVPAPRPSYSVLNKGKIKKVYKLDIPHWRDSLNICFDKFNQQNN